MTVDHQSSMQELLYRFVRREDIIFEEACVRNPHDVKTWIRYAEQKKESEFEALCFVFERALQEVPKSYKIWKRYLTLRVSRLINLKTKPDPDTGLFPMPNLKTYPVTHPEWQIVNGLFEKCLVLGHKFPMIWQLFCLFLSHQPTRVTYTRRTFDRALKALPLTQHDHIWPLYLKFAKRIGGETVVRVYRRYLRLEPSKADDYVDVLLQLDPPQTAEAARVLSLILEHPTKFAGKEGKTTYEYWSQLCDLVCEHPEKIEMPAQEHLVPDGEQPIARSAHLDVDKILRAGITRFSDQVGKLWNGLARWWILRGEFERARDVYEEAMTQVMSVRDFTLVFDAYAKMEEDILASTMNKLADQENDESDDADNDDEALDPIDVDLRLARFENLMKRRPFLVNDVHLRQNPHNVHEWTNRVKLYRERDELEKVVETFAEAVRTVNPHRAHGRLSQLWVEFARFYEDEEKLDDARRIFEQAVEATFRNVDDLVHVWCEWAEMELRHDEFKKAREVMGRATVPPRGPPQSYIQIRYNDESKTPQQRLFKSSKLWAFYVDLEESLGTPESTRAVYDRILELKIATPQIIINYASFLEEHHYFEESYRVYERGIELFGYPIAFEIWNLYLTKFMNRYGGTKLERARDLFEHSLENCPPKFAKSLYLLYAKLEEDYGLGRHAMRIYDRATRAVDIKDRFEMFSIYIAKATESFGLIATREIYEKALEALPDKDARTMAVRFSEVEIQLGEVDRARAILGYASQVCDPRLDPDFWKTWQEFEVKYGNEDTFKEMLRIKRSVQTKYNADVTFLSAQLLASSKQASSTSEQMEITEEGAEEEESETQTQKPGGTRVIGFVRAEKTEAAPKTPAEAAPTKAYNPDEIDIDDDMGSDEDSEEEEDEEGKPATKIEKREVPAAVFGSLLKQKDESNDDDENEAPAKEEVVGAKDRFKRKRD